MWLSYEKLDSSNMEHCIVRDEQFLVIPFPNPNPMLYSSVWFELDVTEKKNSMKDIYWFARISIYTQKFRGVNRHLPNSDYDQNNVFENSSTADTM